MVVEEMGEEEDEVGISPERLVAGPWALAAAAERERWTSTTTTQR
jgi:hypothetical protein